MIRYFVKWNSGKDTSKWKPADYLVRAARHWDGDYILELDYVGAQQHMNALVTTNPAWRLMWDDGKMWEGITARTDTLPGTKIVTVFVRAA